MLMHTKKPNKITLKQKHSSRKRAQKTTHPLVRTLKFLPALLLFGASFGLRQTTNPYHAIGSKNSSVLSYATSISNSDLLTQTNTQRTSNGIAALSLNNQLAVAAQAKANDMVARDYWSHITPTGEQPWFFMSNAGYQYTSAGENLAYGFASSSDTVTGWMNSPPHRENLLNSGFSEVGFGFANSPNYVTSGPETIVVSMYGAPSAPASVASASVASTPPASTQPKAASPTPAASPAGPTIKPQPVVPTTTPEATKNPALTARQLITTSAITAPHISAVASSVRRIQLLTGGYAHWSSTLLVFSICGVGIFWALERGRRIKHLALAGEHYILRHIHIDFAVIAFAFLGISLLQTSGIVR